MLRILTRGAARRCPALMVVEKPQETNLFFPAHAGSAGPGPGGRGGAGF